MAIAMTLQKYLDTHGVEFETVEHRHSYTSIESAQSAHIPGEKVVKAVLLEDDEGYVIAVLPATNRLELGMVFNQTHRPLALASEREVGELFRDCEYGAVPAIGPAYGLETLCEEGLMGAGDLYLEAGDHEHLIHLSGDEFRYLMEGARTAHFSYHS